jgi:hypothetical protein
VAESVFEHAPREDINMVVEDPGGGAVPVQPVMMEARIEAIGVQSQQIQKSASSFAAAAGQGFHIDPQAAATLINACRDSLNQPGQLGSHLYTLDQAPKLGQSPGANVVAPFTHSVVTDPQGIGPAIKNLQNVLQDMIQAYQKASTNYQQTEDIILQSMNTQKSTMA